MNTYHDEISVHVSFVNLVNYDVRNTTKAIFKLSEQNSQGTEQNFEEKKLLQKVR